MKTKIQLFIIALFALAAIATNAQSNPPLGGSNTVAQAAQSGLPFFNAMLNILPAWNPQLTNTFSASEWDIESAPLWKSETAAGTTPYNSTEGDYFFNRNIALGGEIVSLGDGTGNDTIDMLGANFTARKDIGNVAGYLIVGGGYDLNHEKGYGAFGPGIVYGYATGIRLFMDTRAEVQGFKQQDIGWLTRLGVQITF